MPDDLPDFALIGAAKCGTTALAQMLGQHPRIFVCEPKEPGFYAGVPHFDEAGYRALFAGAGDRLRCDASTHYSRRETFPGTAERMVADVPGLKVLYTIREPLQRLRSHFDYRLRQGTAEGSLETVLARNDELVRASLYAWQLEPWLERCGRDRIHVLRMEDLAHDFDTVLRGVFRFLEVDPDVWITAQRANARPAAGSRRPVRVPRAVRALGRLLSPATRRRLKQHLPRRRVSDDQVALSPAVERDLRARFTRDLRALRPLVGPAMDLYGYA